MLVVVERDMFDREPRDAHNELNGVMRSIGIAMAALEGLEDRRA